MTQQAAGQLSITERRLRVGFDARMWHHTGIGRYVRNLLTHLPEVDWVVWAAPGDTAAVQVALPGAEVRVCPAPLFSLQEQAFFARAMASARLDLFHAPHLNAPLLGPVPLVVTLHDLIPLRFPGTHNSRLGGWYFRAMASLATRMAAHVIAVSDHTRGDLVTLLGTPRARITAVLNGSDPSFARPLDPAFVAAVRQQYDLQGRYVLYTGQWKRYKNLEGLLEAFAALGPELLDVKLVLAGRIDPKAGHVPEAIARLGLSSRVVTPGYMTDEDALVALYQGASVFAFPSRYEGFGLPPLEAMAAGVPVVASTAASIPEVVGDAGLLVDPDDTAGWTAALTRVLTEPGLAEALKARGHQRATSFDWRVNALAVLAVYRAVLARVGSPAG